MKSNTLEELKRQLRVQKKKQQRRATADIHNISFPKNLTKKFLIIYLVIMTIIILLMAVYLAGAKLSVDKKVWNNNEFQTLLIVFGVISVILLIYPLTYRRRKKRYVKKHQGKV